MAIDPSKIFMDERLRSNACIYCGGAPETKEHIPPKVFLDRPHPEDLPIVQACHICNNQKSSDEEYLSCVIECVVCGTTDISSLEREKIKKALAHSPKLQSKIEECKQLTPDGILWNVDQNRARSLAVKLAQGHIAYEEFVIPDEPSSIFVSPLCALPPDMLDLFSYHSDYEELVGWPEIGSRGFLRAVATTGGGYAPSWIEVQEGRYRYKIIASSAVAIVIREYLGIYVAWE